MKVYNSATKELLSRPFPIDSIKFRIGAASEKNGTAMPLAYIDARDAYDRLDEVLDPDGWQCEYSGADNRVTCTISVLIESPGGKFEWIKKANGAGETDVEADKGAYSDAFKRAAVLLGVGAYLYSSNLPWVPYVGTGKYKKFSRETETRLRSFMQGEEVEFSNDADFADNVIKVMGKSSAVRGTEGSTGTEANAEERLTLTKCKKSMTEAYGKLNTLNTPDDLRKFLAEYYKYFRFFMEADVTKRAGARWWLTNGQSDVISMRDKIKQSCSFEAELVLKEFKL